MQDTTKGKQERKALLKGEKKKIAQSVKDPDAAKLSLQLVTDIRIKQKEHTIRFVLQFRRSEGFEFLSSAFTGKIVQGRKNIIFSFR